VHLKTTTFVLDITKEIFMKQQLTSISLFRIAALLFFFIFSGCEADEVVDPREKFLGVWLVSESCIRLDYQAVIKADANDKDKVLIENFAVSGAEYPAAYGFVNGNIINLPRQTIGDNWRVEGKGTYNADNTIYWSYIIEIGPDSSNCEADFR
jgi:hypothetical protein